jgi:hypothetical protein
MMFERLRIVMPIVATVGLSLSANAADETREEIIEEQQPPGIVNDGVSGQAQGLPQTEALQDHQVSPTEKDQLTGQAQGVVESSAAERPAERETSPN